MTIQRTRRTSAQVVDDESQLITLRVPRSIIRKVEARARAERRTRSAAIICMMEDGCKGDPEIPAGAPVAVAVAPARPVHLPAAAPRVAAPVARPAAPAQELDPDALEAMIQKYEGVMNGTLAAQVEPGEDG